MNRPSSPMHLSLLSEPIGPIDETDLIALDRQQMVNPNNNDRRGASSPHSMDGSEHIEASDVPASNWNDWDVPIGRGRAVREFIGNERYRELVEQHRSTYLRAKKRKDKRDVSLTIYNVIRSNGGRFLAPCGTKNESWYQISKDKALAKIGQALRIGVRPPQPLYSSWAYPVENNEPRRSSGSSPLSDTSRPMFVDIPGDAQQPQQPQQPQQLQRGVNRSSYLEMTDSISNLSFNSEDPMLLSPYATREFEFAPNHNSSVDEFSGNDWSSLDPQLFS